MRIIQFHNFSHDTTEMNTMDILAFEYTLNRNIYKMSLFKYTFKK